MKTLLRPLLIFFLLISFSNAQDNTNKLVSVENDIYSVTYSESYQQPMSLTYEYPAPSLLYKGDFKPILHQPIQIIDTIRRSLYFLGSAPVTYPDVELRVVTISKIFKVPGGVSTSNDEDYTNSIYKKTHLAPEKSFNSESNQNFVWSYLNCALMHETLKEGVWKELEDHERSLTDSNKVNIEIKLTFSDESEVVDGGAHVPTHFTKIIKHKVVKRDLWGSDDVVKVEVYTFPNNGSVKGKNIEEFKDKNLSYELTEKR